MQYKNDDIMEQQLHNDLNIVIKNMKIREQQYVEILNYKKNLLKNIQKQDTIFNDDKSKSHCKYFITIQERDKQIQIEQNSIVNKYVSQISSVDSIIMLMSRAVARILQMCQTWQEKSKIYDTDGLIRQSYTKMQNILVKFVNNSQKIHIGDIIKVAVTYEKQKVQIQIHRLQNIIQKLQNGCINQILYIDQTKGSEISSLPRSKSKKVTLLKEQNKFKIIKRDQLGQKAKKSRQQAKNNQKIQKQKQNIANKIYEKLYSTMDLVKGNFMNNMIHINPNIKSTQLYEQIMSRNKHNYEQILAFEGKKALYEIQIKKNLEKNEKIQIIQTQTSKNIEKGKQTALPKVQSLSSYVNIYYQSKNEIIPKQSQRNFYLSKPRKNKFEHNQYQEFHKSGEVLKQFKFDFTKQTSVRINLNKLPGIFRPTIIDRYCIKKNIKQKNIQTSRINSKENLITPHKILSKQDNQPNYNQKLSDQFNDQIIQYSLYNLKHSKQKQFSSSRFE